MKVAAILLSGFLAMALNADAQLAKVHSVYLLPMANGLDQYLANRLTNSGVFQVVTDPKKADAVFTDRLGEALESRLAELYPEPAPETPKPEEGQAAEEAKPEGGKLVDKEPPRVSSFGRARGTIFLVDGQNRTVLWSYYEAPKSVSSSDLNRLAGHIVERLTRDLKGK
jgi:hypothetical protein